MTKRLDWATELEALLPPGAVRRVHDDGDFGGASWGPQVRVRTETTDELRSVLEVARRDSIPVAVRGAGHSSGGQSTTHMGLVLQHAPTEEGADIADDWAEVEGDLRLLGMADAAGAIGDAQRTGQAPGEVKAQIEFWHSKPGAWGVGALRHRIAIGQPGMAADACWPEPAAAYERRQRGDRVAQETLRRRRESEERRAAIAAERAAVAG